VRLSRLGGGDWDLRWGEGTGVNGAKLSGGERWVLEGLGG
jgi:hypothetical protein